MSKTKFIKMHEKLKNKNDHFILNKEKTLFKYYKQGKLTSELFYNGVEFTYKEFDESGLGHNILMEKK